MSNRKIYKAIAFSVVKHDYIALAAEAHPSFDIVAVCDEAQAPDWVHERNQEYADRFDIPYIRDLSQAIQELQPEVAIVSPQAERHCELSIQAAEKGLHVIVDKPLSTTLAECDRLVETIQKHRVKCLVWNRNFLPALVQATQTIESGAIGKLESIHCDFYFSKDAGPPKGSRKDGDPPINWLERQIEAHADGSDGGVGEKAMGELEIEGIYPLGYIRLLAPNKIQKVFARTATHFHQANVDNDVDDLATVTLEMEDGVVGSLCIGRIGAASHPDIGEIKLHILGSEGALVISEARPEVSLYYKEQPPLEFKNIRIADENNFLLLESFIEAIEKNSDTILDAQGGRDICSVVEACVRSGKSGKVEVVEY